MMKLFTGWVSIEILFGFKRIKMPLLWLPLVGLAFCLSSCSSVDQDWVSVSGTVKSVQGITDQGSPATTANKVLFNRISFKYTFENKSYENSQIIDLNVPRRFAQGETIALKVNKKLPSLAKIDLPPEVPDRTGMTLRRGLHQETLPGIGTNNDY